MKTSLTILIFAVGTVCALSAQDKKRQTAEREIFSVGDDRPVVKHSVPLSDDELAVLAKYLVDQDSRDPKPTREGLEAGVIHLGSPKERDLVVVGAGPPLMGANVGPFWIIRDLPSGPVVVVHAVCLALTIRKRHTNGLRDIELFSATAVNGTTSVLHFDGTKYRLFKHWTRPLGE